MKRFLKAHVYLAVALSLLLVCSIGCKKDEPQAKEIKIGVIAPLTGDLAEPGTKSFNGIKLAVDVHNEAYPRIPITLIVEDSKALPTEGVNAINKLINIDHVRLVIGDLTSGVTLAVAPIAEKNRVVVLAPGASNPQVREAGEYIFRNWASDSFDGEVMAKYLIRKLFKKSAAIVYVNNEYGMELANAFERAFLGGGREVVLKERYDQGTSDFRTMLAKVKGAHIDCLYLPGQPRENGFLVRQLKEVGINTTVTANLSVESPDFYAGAQEAADGIIFSTPAFDLESNQENVRDFVTRYEAKFAAKPDVVAGHGYDAANIMIKALKMVDYDVSKVKDALYAIRDFPGVTGKTTFDEKGDVVKDVMVKGLDRDGHTTTLELFKPAGGLTQK